MEENSNTRNFCIIAHIDHGKSTLADRFLELTGAIPKSEMKEQVLDDMDLERERGITIKSHPVTMHYKAKDGNTYLLNLIDTPGHVDFCYEVSRSLAACEGAVLLVDASQGVEAQTISNLFLARDANLAIVPVINKIDLPTAHISNTVKEMIDVLSSREDEIVLASAKEGTGVEEILEAVITRVPSPPGSSRGFLKALIFDSVFDQFRGVVPYVRIFDGSVKTGKKIVLLSSMKSFEVVEVGIFKPAMTPVDELHAGDVGYIVAGVKDIQDAKVGDTIGEEGDPAPTALPGYRQMKPMVFSGLYPVNAEGYENLRDALGKLSLNDASLSYEAESSVALGFGFRCGFLGLLHLEIVQERLEREYDVSLVATFPSVGYRVVLKDGTSIMVHNPVNMPAPGRIDRIEEPYVSAEIITPPEHLGGILKLAQEKRGIYVSMEFLEADRVRLKYLMPLSEIVVDFYDKLKSVSRGYASFDYEYAAHRESKLVKLDILLNGDPVDALSQVVHDEKAYERGRTIASALRKLIPKHMFQIAIQASIGGKVIARETISALRKDVTAKCYGGDITRKRKLLEKQKEGKKRMKRIGSVDIPQEAFLSVLRSRETG
ncbi:MAG: translation elongation factor 4 [Candidatus Eisenbacteria bacterium]|nr:translation elongation factor 4 [Candidatus Eisenbacteria bacterium]